MAVNTDALFTNFMKTAENIVTHYDDNKDKRDEMLEKFHSIIERTCMYNEKVKKVQDTVRDLSHNIDDCEDPNEKLTKFRGKKDSLLKYVPDVSGNSNLQQYCQQVKQMVDDADGVKKNTFDDDDIEMTENEVNVIDPFTKKRMTDPVKNKTCGHVYDRESANSMLQINKNTRCPVVGCSNRNPIQLDNLFPDIITKRYLLNNPE